jgi:hypothetical protein
LVATGSGQLVLLHGFDPRLHGRLTPLAAHRDRRDDLADAAVPPPRISSPRDGEPSGVRSRGSPSSGPARTSAMSVRPGSGEPEYPSQLGAR